MLTEKKWYKVTKKVLDVLAYILAAIGGITLFDSCNLRDADTRVFVVRDAALSDGAATGETGQLHEVLHAATGETGQLREVVCEVCGSAFYIGDVR